MLIMLIPLGEVLDKSEKIDGLLIMLIPPGELPGKSGKIAGLLIMLVIRHYYVYNSLVTNLYANIFLFL